MANVAKVAVRWVVTAFPEIGGPAHTWDAVCTFHVMKAAGEPAIDEDDREELNLAAINWWSQEGGGFVEVCSAYPSGIELTDVTSWTILPTVSEPTITELLEPFPGTNIGGRGLHPPQCALGIGLRTLTETRRGRGRMYLPAWTVDAAEEAVGFVSPALQEDLGHIAAHLAWAVRSVYAVGVDDGPFVLCVYSRVAGDPAPVTHFEIPDRILTQRRRVIRPLTHLACSLSTGEPA